MKCRTFNRQPIHSANSLVRLWASTAGDQLTTGALENDRSWFALASMGAVWNAMQQ